MSRWTWKRQLIQVISFCVAMVVLVKWGAGLSDWREVIASENGPVERISAAMWFMGFGWSFVAGWSRRRVRIEWWSLAAVLLLLGLRELDAHIWVTGWNLDKLANYWNPHIPISERLFVVGGLVVPSICVVCVIFFRVWQKSCLGWNAVMDWVIPVLIAIVLLGLSLALDKIGPYVLPFLGIGVSGQIVLMMIEEFVEMVLAVFVLSTLWPYWQKTFLVYEHRATPFIIHKVSL